MNIKAPPPECNHIDVHACMCALRHENMCTHTYIYIYNCVILGIKDVIKIRQSSSVLG